MFENKNFQSWFKENTPKEGLPETTTFSKQFVKDAWDNGYYVGYNKTKEEMQELLKEGVQLLKNSDELYGYQIRDFYLKCKPFIKED